MKKRSKNILAIAGIIGTIMGIIFTVPSFLQEKYGLATGATFLIIGGLVLLAIAFGE